MSCVTITRIVHVFIRTDELSTGFEGRSFFALWPVFRSDLGQLAFQTASEYGLLKNVFDQVAIRTQ